MIYVDSLFEAIARGSSVSKLWCHMTADSIVELHEFAEMIGRKRCWFHKGNHYDLNPEMREKAIQAGAKEVSWKEFAILAKKCGTM